MRRFNPARIPRGPQLGELIERVTEAVAAVEQRKRKRRARDQQFFDEALVALVSDLAHLALYMPSGQLLVDLSHRKLAKAARPAPFMTEKFADLVRLLAAAELVDMELGYRGEFGSQKTALRPSPRLRRMIEAAEVSWEDFGERLDLLKPPLVLRGKKRPVVMSGGRVVMRAPPLALPATTEVDGLRARMNQINAWISGASLEWDGDPAEDGVDLSNRHLQRIFNDGRFDAGGRLYGGFWQPLSAADRLAHLRIAGQPVASVDFCQSGVRQAYALVGRTPPQGDLYRVPGLETYRVEVKQIINALLAQSKPATRFPQGTRGRMPRSWRFEKVRDAIQRAHAPIRELFGTGVGLRFMYQESEVLIRVLLTLMDHGVVALPIHDCVLIPTSAADFAVGVMEQCYLEGVGVPGVVEVELPPREVLRI